MVVGRKNFAQAGALLYNGKKIRKHKLLYICTFDEVSDVQESKSRPMQRIQKNWTTKTVTVRKSGPVTRVQLGHPTPVVHNEKFRALKCHRFVCLAIQKYYFGKHLKHE